MKRFLTIFIAASIFVAAMALTSCSQWADPYKELDKGGSTVSVKYDAGEGLFVGREGVTLVDVFSYDDVNVGGVKLLSPDDEQRGPGNAYTVSCAKHILGGWFVAKTDENGNTVPDLDKPWNFDTDKLNSTYLKDGMSSSEPILTLCAYWIPFTNFEIYIPDGDGFKLHETVQNDVLRIPSWKDDGSIDMKNMPKLDGKTFTGAYLDSALSEKITADSYKIDIAPGEDNPTVKIYTTWDDGEWYKISTPEQLYKHAKVNGCYIIMNDIDFTDKTWPSAFKNNFNGSFVSAEGGSYSISNVSSQSATGADKGAIFGNIGADAKFENVSFENISYTVNGTPKAASFALFATSIDDKASFENVTVSGSLLIANDYATELLPSIGIYSFGIASANGNVDGITLGEILAGFVAPEELESLPSVTVNDDGIVEIIAP